MLGVATVATALIAEALVGSLETFAHDAGLSEFFVAAVIVAIVGNAAGTAARSSSPTAAGSSWPRKSPPRALQVAVFLIPAVALLSWLIDPLALSFRVVELAVVALATIRPRRSSHRAGRAAHEASS